MTGSTQLSELPGGEPDNQGYDDYELLDDIIQNVGDDFSHEVQEQNNNVMEIPDDSYKYPSSTPRSTPMGVGLNPRKSLGMGDLKEPVLITLLILLSSSETIISSIERFLLPPSMEILDQMGNVTFTGSVIKALLVAVLFFLYKNFDKMQMLYYSYPGTFF